MGLPFKDIMKKGLPFKKDVEGIRDHNEIRRMAKKILEHMRVGDYTNARLAAQNVVNLLNNLEKSRRPSGCTVAWGKRPSSIFGGSNELIIHN